MYSMSLCWESICGIHINNRARVDSHVARPDSRVSSAAYPRILEARGADAAEVPRTFRYGVSFCCRWSFLVVPIEASEFEVEFFLRGVECDTRFAKKRSWRLFFLFVFSLIRVSRFGDLEFVENIHQYSSRVVGRELSCKRVGPRIAIRPTNPPLTLAAPPFPPWVVAAAPSPPLSLGRPPSPIFFLLKPLQPSPPKTLAPPFLFPRPRCSPPACSPSCGCDLNWSLEGGRKEEGKNPRWIHV